MAIAFVGASIDITGDGTLPDPSGVANELLIAMIVHSSGTPAGLTGWTQFLQSTINDVVRATFFWIIRGASAPDLTYTGGGSQYNEGVIVYSGTHLTTPVGTTTVKHSASSTTHTSDSIDLIDAASWLLAVTDVIATSNAITVPMGMTSRANVDEVSAWADLSAPADPTAEKTWTFANASNCHPVAIEIRPPAAGGSIAILRRRREEY